MKLAYLYPGRPDLSDLVPPDVAYVVLDAGPNNEWKTEDLDLLKDVDALMVWSVVVSQEALAAARNVKIIQRMGVGYDVLQPILEAAAKRGIPCCNVAGSNKEAVAEHGMLLILAVVRQLTPNHQATLRAEWPRQLRGEIYPFELVGKTLGIVGLGNTGTELAKRARAFGMRIVYNDIRPIQPEIVSALEASFLEKDELFAKSDVISINTDLNEGTRNLADARRLGLMKPKAILVCCARGGIIDELALRDALNSDRIAGAGIDVFAPEPIRPDNPLLGAKNTILTPHIAGVTQESMVRSYEWAHENVRRVVERDQQPRWIVNGLWSASGMGQPLG